MSSSEFGSRTSPPSSLWRAGRVSTSWAYVAVWHVLETSQAAEVQTTVGLCTMTCTVAGRRSRSLPRCDGSQRMRFRACGRLSPRWRRPPMMRVQQGRGTRLGGRRPSTKSARRGLWQGMSSSIAASRGRQNGLELQEIGIHEPMV